MSEPRVAVVGAGVVGLACAWELRRRGADVVVLERAGVGGGVSRGNTGWVSPSLTYPLPGPGMLREGVRQLLTGGDAFVLRPRLDPAFVGWLWSFRRNCSSARFDAGIRALLALNRRTLELFDAYRDAGVEFEMHTAGLVVAARTPRRIGSLSKDLPAAAGAGLRGRFDRRARRWRARRARARARPADVVAGLHARVDRFVRPEQLTVGLAKRLRADGVEIHEGCELRTLARRPGGWALETTSGPVAAHRVVVAAGLPTAPLLRRPGRTHTAHGCTWVQRHDHRPWHAATPCALPGRGQARPEPVRPRRRCRRRVRARRDHEQISPAAGKRLLAAARPYLKGWQPEPDGPVEAWAGLRPATPDGLPLIGALPGLDDIYLATGHGMLGVTLAPATANLLAPLVLEGRALPSSHPSIPPGNSERARCRPSASLEPGDTTRASTTAEGFEHARLVS